jgi:rhamnogalacturonan endolyase
MIRPRRGLLRAGMIVFAFSWCTTWANAQLKSSPSVVLLEDDFSNMPPGALSRVVGAHTEYHFLPEAAPIGQWAISTFRSDIGSQLAWKAFQDEGEAVLAQTYDNKKYRHFHPMIIAGDPSWRDYTLEVRYIPQFVQQDSPPGLSGVVFRYRNDRCYYFFGLDGKKAVLKSVAHATAFHKPFEKVFDSAAFDWEVGQQLVAHVSVQGKKIRAWFEQGPTLTATDSTYVQGKIGLTADVPTHFQYVSVTTSRDEKLRIQEQVAERERAEGVLQASNPQLKLWKKIKTAGFGVGRNIRFGDLDGDGQTDVLIGQVLHHGPKDRNSELSCLTAITLDGKRLWQIGEPDPWKDHLTNDVGFQIHDLDGDGSNEVVYCMNMQIHIADGATGETKRQAPMPNTPANTKPPYNKFPKILGDSIYFCDLRGVGHARDIIIKDRYRHVWALDDQLQVRWSADCNTGHYPFAYDIDDDGRDELAIGYSLFDGDGKQLWTLDHRLKDHADGVAIVQFEPESNVGPHLLYAASDEGMIFADIQGQILKHHYLGHVQNPAVANLRPDLPGLEAISINYWGNQGIIHFYDARGSIYHDFEPCQHGSMCLPINWNGSGNEFFVLSANVEQGGLFDGWGRRAVKFPNDGHPDMCNAVLDITGDCRDEIVVWNPNELWVYTQDDNPKSGRLYKPKRNPLYNYSNYQATVSLPGWSEEKAER